MPSPSLTLLRTQSDDRLVALAREGHERAFEAIVDRYRKPLLRAARRVLPEGRAEDALQQGLLAAWTALQRGAEVHELRPWLYRIVHNTALNALRGGGYDYAELSEAIRIEDGTDEELERRALVRQTLASLAALPERQREALLRTAVSGDPQGEVARDLGLSDNALRQLIHRARVSMRAAATALTPMPLVSAAAAGSSRDSALVERIAELVSVGGGSATLAKAGAVAVIAGGAVSGPAIVDRAAERPPKTEAAASAAPKRERPRPKATPSADAVVRIPVATAAAAEPAEPAPTVLPKRRRQERRELQREHSGRDDGEVERREDREGKREDHSGRDKPEREDKPEHEAKPDRDDDHSGSGKSGSGHDDEPEDEDEQPDSSGHGPEPLATATPTATPDDDHHGEDEDDD
jgi:RNA polymerase sigma factor (sigma-70 family)